MLRFVGGVVPKHEVGWNGPWPPPDRMGLAVGSQSGIVSVFEPTPDKLLMLEAEPTIKVAVYRLRNASRLPDDIDRTRVFRGAEYVPEEATA